MWLNDWKRENPVACWWFYLFIAENVEVTRLLDSWIVYTPKWHVLCASWWVLLQTVIQRIAINGTWKKTTKSLEQKCLYSVCKRMPIVNQWQRLVIPYSRTYSIRLAQQRKKFGDVIFVAMAKTAVNPLVNFTCCICNSPRHISHESEWWLRIMLTKKLRTPTENNIRQAAEGTALC
jgi:hypothetical protein